MPWSNDWGDSVSGKDAMKVEFKEKGISGIDDVPEYLSFFGYKNPRLVSGNIYEVDSIGIDVPSVNVVGGIDNQYGKLIETLRIERNLTASDLANIMLVSENKIKAVEQGTSWFTDTELSMCANVFGVSANALKLGEIAPMRVAVDDKLAEIMEKMADAINSQNKLLELIQSIDEPARYRAQLYHNDNTVVGFAVYDEIADDYIRNEVGTLMIFDTAKEALEEARRLEGKISLTPGEKTDVVSDEVQEAIEATFARAFGYDYKAEWKDEKGPEFDESVDVDDNPDPDENIDISDDDEINDDIKI